jgi:hypothetical protein
MQPHASTPDQDTTHPREPRPPDEPEPIVVRGSEDLVAAVPHLVGFAPERSLVVVSMRRSGRRLRLGLVARFDLPPSGRRPRGREGSAAAVGALADQVVDVLEKDSPDQVVVLVYDSIPCALAAPWQRLVDRLHAAFDKVDVPTLDAFYVCGQRFRSYRCADPDCCPPDGRAVDPVSSAVTAEFVARGSSPLASRAALHATVQPGDPAVCDVVEAAAATALSAIKGCWGDEPNPRWRAWQTESLQLMRQVADRYLSGEPGMGHDEAGRMVAGLCDVPVRDAAAMLFTYWARGWQDRVEHDADDGDAGDAGFEGTRMAELLEALGAPADDPTGQVLTPAERDRALDRFWLDLVTSCDGPLAVAPLTLLGMHVWSQGNGALSFAAVDRALSVDPGYRLAKLLDEALALGVRPGTGRHAGGVDRRVS